MMEKPIKTIKLTDHLKVNLIDDSRKIAGDRWQVCMVAKMDIPVNGSTISSNDKSTEDFKLFRSLVGGKVSFEHKLVRNFIDSKKKKQVLKSLIESFHHGTLTYLSHPDFPKQYVMKQYKEHLKKKTWVYQ